MRIVLPMMAAILLAGCAPTPTPAPRQRVSAAPANSTAAAADLAFPPAGTARSDPPDLSRDARGPTATNGTVQSSTSTFDVTTYNNTTTPGGNFDQQSVTERTGTVQR